MKIQKALASLGFYHGRIDGEVNSFETRSAIKDMNMAYEIGNSASLKPEARDALIFLGTLFEFDRYLISRGTDRRSKGKKIQTALKIHGFYFSKIDGVVGRGTRNAIAQYKAAKGLSYGSSLDFEEEYQLVSSAKQMNDKNIEDTIGTLKGLGVKQAAPVQVLKMQPAQNNATPSSAQPAMSAAQ
jgi:peptidoglycan hydrolase-like protein with peptidoglycan-binding domain